ncbi:MAG: sensor histidine kinase [Haloferacaceae archaeon]
MTTVSPADDGMRRIGGGLAVAAVGFLLTRYPVLVSVRAGSDLAAFLLGDALPLAVGLGLTVYGIGLAASDRPAAEVTTVARWCVAGCGGVGIAIVATGAATGGPAVGTVGSRLVANVLLAGAIGGTITGERSAASQRSRAALASRTDRLTVLNRLLRHEVLNDVTVIRGYAELGDGSDRDEVIRRRTDRISEVVDEVGSIATTDEPRGVALDDHVRRAVAAVRERRSDADIAVGGLPAVEVRGNGRLHLAVEHLLDNAVEHAADAASRVRVEATTDERTATVRVVDGGPGLSDAQRRLLEEGSFPEYDDPGSGFGLPFVRLFLNGVGGRATVETPVHEGAGTDVGDAVPDGDGDSGTRDGGPGMAVTLHLRRADRERARAGVPPERLRRVALAALVAGGVMGALLQATTAGIAVIGALYAGMNAGIGWVVHLFHSVVFGVGFGVGLSGHRLGRYRERPAASAAIGVGYGVLLWLVAAGLVMPLWLRAVGVPAPLPNLELASLAGHIAWGATLGGLFAVLERR